MPGFLVRVRTVLLVASALAWPLAHAMGWPRQPGLFGEAAASSGTRLLSIQQGTEMSAKVRGLGRNDYELASGEAANIQRWYRSSWIDTEFTFLTQLRSDTGLIWGFSTGERGAKYRIDPSVRIGLVFLRQLGPRTHWTLRATTLLGGRLREQACVADYGDIGGVQPVSCRLAADEMQPAETLRYLLNERPGKRTSVSLRFSHDF